MKKLMTAILVGVLCNAGLGQTMSGDWMRVNVEYKDGSRVPNNHSSRLFIRYHFTQKGLFQVFGGGTLPGEYTRAGKVLRIEPTQQFVIETYTDKSLTLLETGNGDPIRYFFIPIDSFQVSGIIKYNQKIVDNDTIFTCAPGIEPIFTKGDKEFMESMMTGITQKVAIEYTYVVQKDGTIGEVTITSTSNPKVNKRLIQIIKKTSGKWIPGSYKGKPVNVLMSASHSLTGRITH